MFRIQRVSMFRPTYVDEKSDVYRDFHQAVEAAVDSSGIDGEMYAVLQQMGGRWVVIMHARHPEAVRIEHDFFLKTFN